MLSKMMSTPEMDQKLRALLREFLLMKFPGSSVKIISMEIRSTDTQPTGFSFVIHINGAVVPKTEAPG